eukprot:TRINITY_DN4309_c0_g1_i1.p1 TRINITY_DN4309_c0_g1~~TRINITY_DN4309_c0_g1_i1.p1  ORF type:complete len:248 (-),score=42.48 TRINITY_DN4309_c0_g1_i1:824-1567(-)
MFAVFPKSVATGPAELKADESSCSKGFAVLEKFKDSHKDAVSAQFGVNTALSFSHERQMITCPRQFAAADDIYCIFSGNLENLPQLRQIYGLSRSVTEVMLILEAYKVLRDRGPYSADQVVADLKGAFTFILYDHKCEEMFMAADHSSAVPLYWGVCQDGSLSVSDDASLLKAACGRSFAPFPRGCLFSSKHALQSWEHPNKELKAIPHVDSQGQVCGANFRVASETDLTMADGEGAPEKKPWLNSF